MSRQFIAGRVAVSIASWILASIFMLYMPMLAISLPSSSSPRSDTAAFRSIQVTPGPTDPTVTALQKEQLIQNVNQQQHDLGNWLWNNAPTLGVIVIGSVGIIRWFGDRRDQRTMRTEERFQSIIEGLGGERTEARTAAAVMLRTFLRPGYEEFYTQVFDLVVANLRLQKYTDSSTAESATLMGQAITTVLSVANSRLQKQNEPNISQNSLSQVLTTVFKESFPRARDKLKKQSRQFDPKSLNAAGIQLDKAYLYGADLQEAWMPEASLREADLKDAKLNPIKLEKANLTGAELNAATLSGADLTRAILTKANLTRAVLPKSCLEGAILKCTMLNYTDLTEAILTKADLTEAILIKADLTKADFTDAILTRADLTGANLTETNPEDASSLTGTLMHDVMGLSEEQRKSCKDKGAIIGGSDQHSASNTNTS